MVFMATNSNVKPPQRYPPSVIKVGAVLYRVISWVDNEGKAKAELEEWIVRSIKRRRGSQTKRGLKTSHANSEFSKLQHVNLTHKEKGVSWGKLSRKHFDYGWLRTIPLSHREKFPVGDNLPYGLYTTKLAAYQHAVTCISNEIIWYEDKIHTVTDGEKADLLLGLDEQKKELVVIERYLKRCKTNRSKAV